MTVTLRAFSSFAAMACLAIVPATAETVSDAVSAALRTNPQLEIQRTEKDLARETLEQARAQGRTTVDVSGSAGFESTDTDAVFAFGLGDFPIASAQVQASKPVYTGGLVRAGVRQAEAGIEAANAQFDSATQDLILDVITAFVDVRQDRQAVSIRRNNVDLASAQFSAAQDRFDVGVVTRTDVSVAEANLEGARAALAGAEATLEGSIATYIFLTGLVPGDLEVPPPVAPLPASVEEAIETGISNNPDIEAARHAERAASEAIKVAKAQYAPRVSIVGSAGVQERYGDDGRRDTSVTALAQGTIPLVTGGLKQSEVRSARLQREQARQQIMTLERAIRAQVLQAWFGYEAAQRSISASRRQVEAAEIAYEGANEELAVGVRTTLDVLDQEQQLFEARLSLVQAERDAYVAAHTLLRAVGDLGRPQ